MKKQNTWMLVEASMMIALSVVLGEFITLFKMPMGGSVTLGAMVPIFFFAYRWGGVAGMLVGVVYGVLDLVIGGIYSVHPISIIFDYIIAYGILGVAGFFKKNTFGQVFGIFTGVFGRFLCHVYSGVAVFASYAPEGQDPIIYSILYNGTFLAPEFLITLVLTLFVIKFVKLPEPKRV